MTGIDQWLDSLPKRDDTAEDRRITRGELLAGMYAQQQQMMLQQAEIITNLEMISDLLMVQLNNEQLDQARKIHDRRVEQDTLHRIEKEMEK